MTLAPIRGAPPGAPVPDFPVNEPRAKPEQASTATALGDPPEKPSDRQPYMPIDVRGGDIVLTFRVIPELPAIARASMTIHIAADLAGSTSPNMLGFLRMSAANARMFLADVRNGHSPAVATGDEDGTVEIECEFTHAEPVILIRQSDHRHILCRCTIDLGLELRAMADAILADLGA